MQQSNGERPCLMFVLGMLPTKIGGMEKFLRSLAVGLNDRGWNTVFCFDGPMSEQFSEYFRLPFVTIERVDNQGGIGAGCVGQLWSVLRKHRPQVFVYAFHSVRRTFPWIARLAGCKRIFFNDHSSRAPGMVPRPVALHNRLLGLFLTSPIDAIVSVADFTRRTGAAFGITSAPNIVVTNGVELKPDSPERRAEFRARYGIPADAIVVTQVCWMVPVKGVDVMLRAAQAICQRHANVRFLLVGGGDQLDEYRRLAVELGIAEQVTFTGIVSDPVGAGVFDASDIYAQPSIWQEACPLAVLEAMSKSLPVIASRTGGLPELVTDGATGVLFPVGDTDALAAALDQLIADPTLRKRLGDAGREAVLRRHLIEHMVQSYLDIFLGGADKHQLKARAAETVPAPSLT